MAAAGSLIARDGAPQTVIVARKGHIRSAARERRSHALRVPAWGRWENPCSARSRSPRRRASVSHCRSGFTHGLATRVMSFGAGWHAPGHASGVPTYRQSRGRRTKAGLLERGELKGCVVAWRQQILAVVKIIISESAGLGCHLPPLCPTRYRAPLTPATKAQP